MNNQELLESLNCMDDSKLLAMNKETFEKWVKSFANLPLKLEQTHRLISLVKRFDQVHKDLSERTETLKRDLYLIDELNIEKTDFEVDERIVACVISYLEKEKFNATKTNHLITHQPFVGIPDLGDPRLVDLFNEFQIDNFGQLSKAIAMLHSPTLYDANEEWLVNQDKPSLDDCICFYEDAQELDEENINYAEFKLHSGYIPSKEWVHRHVKTILTIANIYLNSPLKYYMAYISSHKAVLQTIDINADLIEQLIPTKDIEKETMLLVLIDMLEHGYSLSETEGEY